MPAFALPPSLPFVASRECELVRGRKARVASGEEAKPFEESALLDRAMDRYAAGDDAAFGEVYDRLVPRLHGFLLRRTSDRARVEDVIQQTMLQIHRARGRFVPGARVVPWAFAIARRLLVDQHRRGDREIIAKSDDDSREELLVALDTPSDDVVAAKEIAARVEEELARLPENQRTAFELIKRDGLSVAEAAEMLGTTVSAVKLRAHRAYEALRSALADLAPERAAKGDR
ncbi:RNA polymerase sigma-70 factor, ECF subfamily [Labilithrix luteola]|uniref:RNA polymerase sigma-70 factor, ECF subfamily n=1 Tax=Labilithrix luteola TaxID=1391654 RepID=A0A0K1QCY6_9BACT|nr:RNA polymerase sigma-70 factor, ECF subfamily [Labilithrix luteola]